MALEILTFKSPSAFRNWLEKNHAATEGIWLRVFKKDSREQSITYGEALDQALCYGWIDGQKKAHDVLPGLVHPVFIAIKISGRVVAKARFRVW